MIYPFKLPPTDVERRFAKRDVISNIIILNATAHLTFLRSRFLANRRSHGFHTRTIYVADKIGSVISGFFIFCRKHASPLLNRKGLNYLKKERECHVDSPHRRRIDLLDQKMPSNY